MDPAALSVMVFGIYLLFAGSGFLLIPNVLLPLFKFPRTEEPWIRVAGALVLIIALYYLVAACYHLRVIYWTSVFGRTFAFLCFAGLVITRKAKPMLLLFGLIDLLGAAWTLIVLPG